MKFSAKGYVNLKVLNIYDNQLSVLSDLPSSLERLQAQNNNLKKLSLKEAQSLKQLNVSNNPMLILEHVPDSLEHIEMENNPFTEVVRDGDLKKGKEDRVEFLDALYIYFKLKNAYEKKLLQKKRNAFRRGHTKKEGRQLAQQVKEPCVYCKRNVGTHFFTKDDTFYAVCGDKRQPCELDIQIFRGEYFPLKDLMKLEKDEIEKKKEEIITLKMDNLFKYVGESETGIKFKKTLEEFNEERNNYKETLEKYDKVYDNVQRDHEIKKKQEKVYEIQQQIQLLLDEFQEKENREILIAAMEMLKTDLIPAIQNLRFMKYETMYVDEKYVNIITDKNNKKRIDVPFDFLEKIYGVWTDYFPLPEQRDSRPVWIIDGQHRIRGFGSSKRGSRMPIPYVLIVGDGSPKTVANIALLFTQINTKSEPLDDLHKIYLNYQTEN